MKKFLLLALVAIAFVVVSCAAPAETDTGATTTSPSEQLLKLRVLKNLTSEEPVPEA